MMSLRARLPASSWLSWRLSPAGPDTGVAPVARWRPLLASLHDFSSRYSKSRAGDRRPWLTW